MWRETPSITCPRIDECNKTEVICTSHCPESELYNCHPVHQCNNGELFSRNQLCNGQPDCSETSLSDETQRYPGFKCSQSRDSCVLSYRNLYDDVPHCPDQSDLCFQNASCFECLHNKMYISHKQVCDGVFDCPDFSDECLCFNNINLPVCKAIFETNGVSTNSCSFITPPSTGLTEPQYTNVFLGDVEINPLYGLHPGRVSFNMAEFLKSTYTEARFCRLRFGYTLPIYCDGYPDCRDYKDECNCENPPSFCNDICFSFYPLGGDRYCNGLIDPVWEFINDSSCPQGFDEVDCPNRFYCTAGDYISIDSSQVCNGEVNCDDASDEQNCISTLFSSDTEMIANPVLRSAFWIIGIIVIAGNVLVILPTIKMLKTKKLTDSLRCQHTIILNISFADLIMGMYLLIISVVSAIYSGSYGKIDYEWRSGIGCSIIGSLAIISSEASCFLMVTLTAFRLRSISNPIASVTMSTRPWQFCMCASWVAGVILGVVPYLTERATEYFIYRVLFQSSFSKIGVWEKDTFTKFICHYIALTNHTDVYQSPSSWNWNSKRQFLEDMVPENFTLDDFGYYGETSICMPRLYVQQGDSAWEFTISLMTINFLAFVFIVSSYVIIYIKSTKKAKALDNSSKQSSKQESIMQKRIARILATDFCCWIPISTMSYMRFGGVDFLPIVYQISAVFLLPINSLLNPFLYSSLPDKLVKMFSSKKKKQKPVTPAKGKRAA